MGCIQPSMSPTYISYLLKQTESGGEIANSTQCPSKCLHVVQSQRFWATKPVHTSLHWGFTQSLCSVLNAYWTIHLFFLHRFYYGVLCKKHIRQQFSPFSPENSFVDKSNNTECYFPVLKFNRTAKQKLYKKKRYLNIYIYMKQQLLLMPCRAENCFGAGGRVSEKHRTLFVPVVTA